MKLDKTLQAPMNCQEDKYGLDKQWLELIMQAKQLGFSTDDVRHFLRHRKMSKLIIQPEHD